MIAIVKNFISQVYRIVKVFTKWLRAVRCSSSSGLSFSHCIAIKNVKRAAVFWMICLLAWAWKVSTRLLDSSVPVDAQSGWWLEVL